MSLPLAAARRPSVLIVGCGDIGQRVLRLMQPRWRVLALTRTALHADALRALGAVPLLGDLDDAATLFRMARVADAVLHLAPPPTQAQKEGAVGAEGDPRTQALLRALVRGGRVRFGGQGRCV